MKKLYIILFLLLSNTSYSQSFSCPYGTTAACLDFGDKVCSSMGKCVDSSAKCFSSMTCFGDFVCESDYQDCNDNYNRLVKRFNDLLNNYDDAINNYNNLINDYNNNIEEKETLQNKLIIFTDCIFESNNITSARNCIY